MLLVGPNAQLRNMFSCAMLFLRSSHYNQLVLDQSRNCATCQPCASNWYWTNHAISRRIRRACAENSITTDVSDQSRNCAELLLDTLLYFWYLDYHPIHMYWTKHATAQICSGTSYITLLDILLSMFLVLRLLRNQHVLDQTRNCADLQWY